MRTANHESDGSVPLCQSNLWTKHSGAAPAFGLQDSIGEVRIFFTVLEGTMKSMY